MRTGGHTGQWLVLALAVSSISAQCTSLITELVRLTVNVRGAFGAEICETTSAGLGIRSFSLSIIQYAKCCTI